MNHLYAPWRCDYHESQKKGESVCPFCEIRDDSIGSFDEQREVLYRGRKCFIVMNKYPYAPGHILVVPYEHCAMIDALQEGVYEEMMQEAKMMIALMQSTLHAQGVNMGMNLGKAAGAGIEEHLHMHVIPRWIGDTNFITTIGETRVFANDKKKIFEMLRSAILDRKK